MGAWNGGGSNPNSSMAEGFGFVGFTAIGASTFGSGSFYGQNSYNWTNGAPSLNVTSLAGSASIYANGDGVRLSVDVESAGTYQLKFTRRLMILT